LPQERAFARGTLVEDSKLRSVRVQRILLNDYGSMKRDVGFLMVTIVWKMWVYPSDSKAPMHFGALLSAGSKLIQATIGDDLVHLQKRLYLGVGDER
jgi:hypothetical protein